LRSSSPSPCSNSVTPANVCGCSQKLVAKRSTKPNWFAEREADAVVAPEVADAGPAPPPRGPTLVHLVAAFLADVAPARIGRLR
jgi:hypothetical protein